MKVHQLIDHLAELPPNDTVILWQNDLWHPVTKISYLRENGTVLLEHDVNPSVVSQDEEPQRGDTE